MLQTTRDPADCKPNPHGIDDGILIDSSGLPNSIRFPLTAVNNHNGVISEEIRLIYVVQQKTGLPLFFRYVAGNVIDVSTLKRTIAELKANGVETNFAILDAGYYTGVNADALFDAILSLSTLIAAIISIFYHISLEGILGVIISIVIIKASIDMIKETVDSMLGERIDKELSLKIKKSIEEIDGVYGAYDLNLHSYGPENMQGSVHVEIDDDLTASEIHTLTREITLKIYKEYSIPLTVGIYARNDEYDYIRHDLEEIVSQYDEVLQIHGFYVYEAQKIVSFDIIVDFDADREKIKGKITSKIKEKYPEFDYLIIDDYDISD